ncbi:MAG: PH domain-containing protein [Planctomycetota bacterium]|jgi:hypothetical protein
MLPQLPEDVLQNELAADEKLLWSDQPRLGLRLQFQDLFMIPFTLVWCGIVGFIAFAAFSTPVPLPVLLFFTPFFVAGFYMLIGRFIVDARQRANTFYGVTNDRIIIVSGIFRRNVQSLNLRVLADVSLSERADRSGTVTFGPSPAFANMMPAGWPGAAKFCPPRFDTIPEAREVYQLIQATQRELPPQ